MRGRRYNSCESISISYNEKYMLHGNEVEGSWYKKVVVDVENLYPFFFPLVVENEEILFICSMKHKAY